MQQRTKKVWKRIITLVLALSLILSDIPLGNIIRVNAGNEESDIVSITYGDRAFNIDSENTDVLYVDSQDDTIEIEVRVKTGIDKVKVVKTGDTTASDDDGIPVTDDKIRATIEKDTEYTITAGSTSAIIKWVQDNTSPVINKITDAQENEYSSDTNYVKTGTEVRIYVDEENTDKLSVAIDNGDYQDTDCTVVEDESRKYFRYTAQQSGVHKFKVTDKALLESDEKPVKFEIDDTAPMISRITYTNGDVCTENENIFTRGGTADINVYVSDDVYGKLVVSNADSTIEYTELHELGLEKYYSVKLNMPGDYRFELFDKAGNSSAVITKTLEKDDIIPEITNVIGTSDQDFELSRNDINYVKENIIKIKATDANLKGVKVTSDNATYDELAKNGEYFEYTITGNEVKEYIFKAYDKAGNESDESRYRYRIKMTTDNPKFDVKVANDVLKEKDAQDNINYFKEDKIILTIDVEDVESGVKEVKVGDNVINKAEGQDYYIVEVDNQKEYSICVKSNAGCTTTKNYKFAKINPPVISVKNTEVKQDEINYTANGEYQLTFKVDEGIPGKVSEVKYKINGSEEIKSFADKDKDGNFVVNLNNIDEAEVSYVFWCEDNYDSKSDEITLRFKKDASEVKISSSRLEDKSFLGIQTGKKLVVKFDSSLIKNVQFYVGKKSDERKTIQPNSSGEYEIESTIFNNIKLDDIKFVITRNIANSDEQIVAYSSKKNYKLYYTFESNYNKYNYDKENALTFNIVANNGVTLVVEYEIAYFNGSVYESLKSIDNWTGNGSQYSIPISEFKQNNILADGNYGIKIKVISGNTYEENVYFLTVDLNDPVTGEIKYDDAGKWIKSDSAKPIKVTNCTDNLSGVSKDKSFFHISNNDNIDRDIENDYLSADLNSNDNSYTMSLDLKKYLTEHSDITDGKYTVTFTAVDEAGNKADSNSIEIWISNADVEFNADILDEDDNSYGAESEENAKWVNKALKLKIDDINVGVSGLKSVIVKAGGVEIQRSGESDGYVYDLQNIDSGKKCIDITVTNGNTSKTKTLYVNIDKTDPIINDFAQGFKQNIWLDKDSNSTIVANCSDDNSGLSQENSKFYIYKENGDNNIEKSEIDSDYINVDNNKFTLDIGRYLSEREEGIYTVEFIACDNAGNKSDAETVTVRFSKTDVSFDANVVDASGNTYQSVSDNAKWVNTDKTPLKLNIKNIKVGVSGLNKLNVKLNGNPIEMTDDDAMQYESEELNLSEGSNEIVIEITNEADASNMKISKTETLYVYVDNTAPEIDRFGEKKYQEGFVDPKELWTSKQIEMNVESKDSVSSVVKTFYCIQKADDKSEPTDNMYIEYKGNIASPTYKNAEESKNVSGIYIAYFYVVDMAGNKSEVKTVDNIKFDVTKPDITYQILKDDNKALKTYIKDGITWYNQNVKVRYNFESSFSMLALNKYIAYIEKKETGNKLLGYAAENDYRFNDELCTKQFQEEYNDKKIDGKWIVELKAYNQVNESDQHGPFEFGIDTLAPTCDNIEYLNGNTKLTSVNETYYSDKPITIKVSNVKDTGSGIAKVELVKGNSKNVLTNDGKGNYSITLNDKKTYKDYSIVITDHVGNAKTVELPNMVISDKKAVIKYSDPSGATRINGKLWYSHNLTVPVEIVNHTSGIQSYLIKINDVKVAEKSKISQNEKKDTVSVRVNTKNADANEDNSYVINTSTTDIGGHTSNKPKTYYIDGKAPRVTGFKFAGVDSTDVISTTYGYFFAKDTNVIVSAADARNESGLKNISFYTIDKDNHKSEVITKRAANGSATFTVKANFKGQIYAYATDNVDNSSKAGKLAGAIIEKAEDHDKFAAITFDKRAASMKDIDGRELYNADVPVTINLSDTYSGISHIAWRVVSDDENAEAIRGSIDIDNNGNITGDTEGISKNVNDANIVTALSKRIVVGDNSNNIRVNVTMTDNVGHRSSKSLRFSIDKTAPVINISYDNNAADNTNTDMFKNVRRATIRVTERNFAGNDVKIKITNTENTIPAIGKWSVNENGVNGDGNTYSAVIEYTADGDYTFDISYADKAANQGTVSYGNSVAPQKFTIDRTVPVMSVNYDNNVANGTYYQNSRVATITIVEHNFSADRFNIAVRENGRNSAKTIGNWTNNGDRHTATIAFNNEAEFSWDASYTDMAGNRAANNLNDTFTVDTEEPTLVITGVDNNKSYRDDTVGVTITAGDTYFADLKAALTRIDSKGKKTDIALTPATVNNGKSFSLSNITEDGIYVLSSEASDKSGKTVTDTRTFSVNRNGSTFAITDKATSKLNNTYVNEAGDIVLFETNANRLDMSKTAVTLYRDLEIVELKEGRDYTIEAQENEGEWCKYTYTIKKENFLADGHYRLTIYSEDSVGNVALSDNSDKNASLEFVVDNTKPICNIIDLKSNHTYAVDNKTVQFTVEDNIELQSVSVMLNDKEVMKLSDAALNTALESGNLSFDITSSNSSQDVVIKCIDKAGNEQDTEISDFYVTTNLIVRYTNNKALVIASIIALIVIVGAIVVIIVTKSRKKKNK